MHYVGRRRSQTNPLASIPLFRPAADVMWSPSEQQLSAPETYEGQFEAPSDEDLRRRELANAEAALADAVRVLDAARAEVEDAKRTGTDPILSNGRVIMPSIAFSPERLCERQDYARDLLSRRLAEMAVARGRVEAARGALGLPTLVETEEQAATDRAVRASKRVPVSPIASPTID